MTGVTAGVSIQSGRNRQRRAAPQGRAVTSAATVLRFSGAGHVLRMIETDIEIFFEAIGKSFARRVAAIHALVADRAHRNVWRCELCEMTTGARFVSRKIWAHRIV